MQVEVVQDRFNRLNLIQTARVVDVDHMQQDVGTFQFFQSCPEGDLEVFRQILDESHGIGDDYLGIPWEAKAPAGRVQGGKQSFFSQHLAAGECIQQGRFPRVCIAHNRNHGKVPLGPF